MALSNETTGVFFFTLIPSSGQTKVILVVKEQSENP